MRTVNCLSNKITTRLWQDFKRWYQYSFNLWLSLAKDLTLNNYLRKKQSLILLLRFLRTWVSPLNTKSSNKPSSDSCQIWFWMLVLIWSKQQKVRDQTCTRAPKNSSTWPLTHVTSSSPTLWRLRPPNFLKPSATTLTGLSLSLASSALSHSTWLWAKRAENNQLPSTTLQPISVMPSRALY